MLVFAMFDMLQAFDIAGKLDELDPDSKTAQQIRVPSHFRNEHLQMSHIYKSYTLVVHVLAVSCQVLAGMNMEIAMMSSRAEFGMKFGRLQATLLLH